MKENKKKNAMWLQKEYDKCQIFLRAAGLAYPM